ncbi:MAG: hypothetical protein WCV92_04245 [Candidatus Buchananbacteria bacterium]
MEICVQCAMPIDETTKCTCEESICHHCCSCESGCECGCSKKE